MNGLLYFFKKRGFKATSKRFLGVYKNGKWIEIHLMDSRGTVFISIREEFDNGDWKKPVDCTDDLEQVFEYLEKEGLL